MPIVEYKCSEEHISERIVPDVEAANAVTKCIICGRLAEKVEVSHSSFRLMPGGSGGFHKPSSS